VLIIGAHAVQIAKSMGAAMTAVDGPVKKGLLRRIGADHFVDYTAQDFRQGSRSYDVIFDMVPSSSYSDCVELLNPNGRYLVGNARLSAMLRTVFTSRFSDKRATFAFARETREESHPPATARRKTRGPVFARRDLVGDLPIWEYADGSVTRVDRISTLPLSEKFPRPIAGCGFWGTRS
jgi:NADPH:quinone reductase-like Zn-dependent oxidoreductase